MIIFKSSTKEFLKFAFSFKNRSNNNAKDHAKSL